MATSLEQLFGNWRAARASIQPSGLANQGRRVLISLDEAQLKLGDLRQAVDYEKKHRYIDVQGRKKTFSRFVSDTLKDFNQLSLAENGELAVLITKFDNYRFMDLGGRISALQSFEDFLEGFAVGVQPQRKTLTREEPAGQAQSDGVLAELPIHEMPAQYLKGVGPRMAALLKMLGIETVENLLYYFPRRYLDYNNRRSIADLGSGIFGGIVTATEGGALDAFHPAVRHWFDGRFEAPTRVQERGPREVQRLGRSTLDDAVRAGATLAELYRPVLLGDALTAGPPQPRERSPTQLPPASSTPSRTPGP